ncbi:MAG: NADH oxidase [Syntrophorhabdus sp. PtaB.Bin047]|nr:MAG: NADH oxidase [Syntrophorhabdus sp. PtaB.Bin047]
MSAPKKLFEPIKVGNVELKNRVMMLGVTTGFLDNYYVTDKYANFMGARARGGTGLVVIGSAYPFDLSGVTPRYINIASGVGIWTDDQIPGLSKVAKNIHDNGGKAACQLVICSEWRANKDNPLEGVGPSAGAGGPSVKEVRELTVDEIRLIVDQYAEGARRAREAGFDMVEFHAGIGYFINRFLSPYSNRRTDEYGGTPEKRMRFFLEVIEACKAKAGADFTLAARISGDELLEGGNKIEDVQKMIPVLEKAGLAYFNVQAGWHESPIPLVQQWVPEGAFVYLGEAIKKVATVPVAVGYRLKDPIMAEEIVAAGKVDMIAMARQLIADADWANKAQAGKLDDIRKCITCCRCMDDNFVGVPITCSVNTNLEGLPETPAEKPKKVMVIGGGPSGLEAARVATMRGHKVTVFEKGKRLGGLTTLASVLNSEIEPFHDWLVKQVKDLNIEVKLGTEVKPDTVDSFKPDVVILAAGGSPAELNVPGIDSDNVISSHDIEAFVSGQSTKKGLMWTLAAKVGKDVAGSPALMRKMLGLNFPIKKRVAIIGGQFSGCELALTLMEKGKQVRIIEETKRLGADIGPVTRWVEMDMMKKGGVAMEPLTKVKEITDKGVKAVREDGTEVFFEADTILLALGLKENMELAEKLKGKVGEVYVVGESAGGGGKKRLREAMNSGRDAGAKI